MAFDPDAQERDWYGWLTTQAGHAALVGMPAAWVLVPFFGPFLAPVIVAVAYLALWEILKQRAAAGWADALTDTACVMAGASTICGAAVGYWTAATCMTAWGALLAFGVWRRR
jgi:hypothetical protein